MTAADAMSAHPHGTPALLTLDEVATRLRIGRRTARRLADNGELPIIRTSARTIRVSEDALREYLLSHTETRGETAADYRIE